MSTPTARNVHVTSRALTVELCDGRSVSVPPAWYPRLANATPRERQRWELIGPGIGIHWPAVDEDVPWPYFLAYPRGRVTHVLW